MPGPSAAAAPPAPPLHDVVEACIVRAAGRTPDWSVSAAWAAADPRYRRGLLRCIDAAVAAGEHTIPAGHFTLFMEAFPPGCEGGLHAHPDAEEAYVVLEGQGVRLRCERAGEVHDTRLARHDVACVPAGLYRVVINDGPDDALVLVVFGSGRPEKSQLSPTHPMAKLPRP